MALISFVKRASEEVGLELSCELIERVDGGGRQPTVPPSSDLHRVVGKALHIMAYNMSYRTICARNAATCSIGSEPPSYTSSFRRRKCYKICALRELMESEESISGSGGLRADALGVDVGSPTASPEGARSYSGESWGRLLVGCVARGQPSVSDIAPIGARASGVTAETPRLSGGGVNRGSLNRRQYHPGVWEGRFLSPNKGSGSGGYGAPPEIGCVTGRTSSPRLSGVERSCGFFPRSVWRPTRESPPGVDFIHVHRWPTVPFLSIFAASFARVFNAASIVGYRPYCKRACGVSFQSCCHTISSDSLRFDGDCAAPDDATHWAHPLVVTRRLWVLEGRSRT
ncbi:hypothetical protein B296_00045829 [Ensete ventricosum]|uniref:Uncharacterized protein n=1 Tax=Ensete ventricosum TaxID=4639 RepID=A0A426X488_ENSVE|nr:hypothetical protein B296_00045829 [Ensete ventricosum]